MCSEWVFSGLGSSHSVLLQSPGLCWAHVSDSTSRAHLPASPNIPTYVTLTSKRFRSAHMPAAIHIKGDKFTSVHVPHISTWSSASLIVSQHVGQLGLCGQRGSCCLKTRPIEQAPTVPLTYTANNYFKNTTRYLQMFYLTLHKKKLNQSGL